MKIEYKLDELSKIVEEIIPQLAHPVVLLKGEMGAGKTTMIREIVRQMGVEDNVSSPTFSLVNQYGEKEKTIYHFDFYRIESQREAIDIAVEEYLNSQRWCFIEWSQKIEDLLPDEVSVIEIEKTQMEDKRVVNVYNMWGRY